MRSANKRFQPIVDLPPFLLDFFTTVLCLSIQPSPPKSMQLGSNLGSIMQKKKSSRNKVNFFLKKYTIVIYNNI
jgi:hypothetical protein